MGKAPAFQFYVADWLQDTGHLTLAAKGAWIDLLCRMWRSQNRGSITHDWQGYARLLGATVDQAKAVIGELTASNDDNPPVCNGVTHADGKVTLVCRRMSREARESQNHAARQHRYRERKKSEDVDAKSDAEVTRPSSSSSSNTPLPPGGVERVPVDPPGFVRFWEAYPRSIRKTDRGKCLKRWRTGKLEPIADRVLAALDVFKRSEMWRKEDGRFIHGPLVWLNKAPWETDLGELAEASAGSNGTYTPPRSGIIDF